MQVFKKNLQYDWGANECISLDDSGDIDTNSNN